MLYLLSVELIRRIFVDLDRLSVTPVEDCAVEVIDPVADRLLLGVGVLAIIITIMVLELKAPHEATVGGLLPLLPVSLGQFTTREQSKTTWARSSGPRLPSAPSRPST